MKYTPKQVKKALVAAATFVTQLIALGVLDGTAALVAAAVVTALGTYGVFAATNEEVPA